LDIGVLGYIGIVWPKEHSPEVWSVPPVTPCIVDQKQVLKIWDNYITELYNLPNQPENLEVESEEEEDKDEKPLIFGKVKWKKLPTRWGIRKLQEMVMYLGMYSKCWEKMASD